MNGKSKTQMKISTELNLQGFALVFQDNMRTTNWFAIIVQRKWAPKQWMNSAARMPKDTVQKRVREKEKKV